MTPVPHRECWPHLYMQQQQSAASIVPQLCSGSNLLPFALPQSGSLHDVVQTLACTTCCAFAFVVIFSGSELTPTGTAPTAAIMSSRRAMRFIPDVILTLTLSKLSANPSVGHPLVLLGGTVVHVVSICDTIVRPAHASALCMPCAPVTSAGGDAVGGACS